MSKIAWATDTHLDFIDGESLLRFAAHLVEHDPAGVILTGDISNSKQLIYHLSVIERVVQRPIYFVLGNHDYFGSDIVGVRKAVHELINVSQMLKYLSDVPYVPLSSKTALLGHDCWYDAAVGNVLGSTAKMNDWFLIREFGQNDSGNLRQYAAVAKKLAHEGAVHVMTGIKAAVRYYSNIVIATHFPPFLSAYPKENRINDPNLLPWYTSKVLGDVLLDAARTYKNVNFTVLCGHVHEAWNGRVEKNLEVRLGGAKYGAPMLSGYMEVA